MFGKSTSAFWVWWIFVYGFCFTGIGIYCGSVPLAKQLCSWMDARHYISVPARVKNVELEGGDGGGAGLEAIATFYYSYAGRSLNNERVDILEEWGIYHSDLERAHYNELKTAENNNSFVTLWVDPREPDHAVFDRKLYIYPLLFNTRLAFAIPFTALGLFALATGCKCIWKKRSRVNQNAPINAVWWQNEIKWRGPFIYPTKNPLVGAFVSSLIYNAIVLPITLFIYSDSNVNLTFKTLTSLAPIVGLYSMLRCLHQLYLFKQFGIPAITLALPLHLGEATDVQLHIPNMRKPAKVKCQFICRTFDCTDREIKKKTLWNSEDSYITQKSNSGWQQRFLLTPMAGLPESTARDGFRHDEWILRIQIGRWVNEIWLPVI